MTEERDSGEARKDASTGEGAPPEPDAQPKVVPVEGPPGEPDPASLPVTVFTVGYGNRSLDDLLALLDARRIDFLLDVRSRPYSRFRPEFSKEQLERGIRAAGLTYGWVGAQLGGIPDSPDVVREDGTVDGERWVTSAPFQLGIARLLRAQTSQYRVALMCGELRPEDCHRSRLIGAEMLRHGIDIVHIDEKGCDISQTALIERQTGGQHDLFDASPGEPTPREEDEDHG